MRASGRRRGAECRPRVASHREWAPSGREIYYRATGGRMMVATAPAAGHPRVAEGRCSTPRATSRDSPSRRTAQRLLMMPRHRRSGQSTTINLVLDFLDELRQRVR